MKNIFIFLFFSLFLLGCTPHYTEKQSEALSATVYAIADSVDSGRYDLVDQYAPEAKRIVVPPKKRIAVKPLINPDTKQKYTLIPQRLASSKVVVVGNEEYNLLLKNSQIAIQLEKDNADLIAAKILIDNQLQHQEKINNEMVLKINSLEKESIQKDKKLAQKDLRITQLWIVIVVETFLFGLCAYLRIKNIL